MWLSWNRKLETNVSKKKKKNTENLAFKERLFPKKTLHAYVVFKACIHATGLLKRIGETEKKWALAVKLTAFSSLHKKSDKIYKIRGRQKFEISRS